jgi:hypothetical protein
LVSGRAPEPNVAPYGLIGPCTIERLVNVPAFAAYSLGDISTAHHSLAQGNNARTVEGDSGLVNALRLFGIDANALPITDEPSSISATMPSTVRTIRLIGPP